ncbi:MAG: lysylphosphatidylglycerol synthase domain-containing protein [Actinomycetota bacterium]|nr:lysylphosphatidylglycerol synthase domain-containing protein [Actinomycetota bacterium]
MGRVTGAAGSKARKKRIWRIAQIVISVVLVVAIFFYAIPKLADYSAVWDTIRAMTWLEIGTLFAATIFNLFTYWWQNMASLPGLRLSQAAVCNQTTTTIADTIPAGGYVALGLTYGIYRSWGFSNGAITLSVLITGVWNIFMKLGLPVIALAALAITGAASTSLVTAAAIGMAILIAGVVLFGLILWKKSLARSIGSFFSGVVNRVLGLVHKGPVDDWGDAAVRFRGTSIELVAKRWGVLTLTTVVSHLALYFILLLALRHVGVSEQEISWAQVLGVFAFGRLVTAVPITPGGLGLIELSYIGGLILAGRDHADVSADVFRAQVAAAVLVFRLLTYGIQIPLGAFTYLIWRSNTSWRKEPPEDELEVREPGLGVST